MSTLAKERLPIADQFPGTLPDALKTYKVHHCQGWNKRLIQSDYSAFRTLQTSQRMLMTAIERAYDVRRTNPFHVSVLDPYDSQSLYERYETRKALRSARYFNKKGSDQAAMIMLELPSKALHPAYFRWLSHNSDLVTVYFGQSPFSQSKDAVFLMTRDKYLESIQSDGAAL